MPISTHILDTTKGRPAADVQVKLEVLEGDVWRECGGGHTNADGRLQAVLATGETLKAATYRLHFMVKAYLDATHQGGFYPEVIITFVVQSPNEHFHVPLLLNPFGYSTYRGS